MFGAQSPPVDADAKAVELFSQGTLDGQTIEADPAEGWWEDCGV